MGYMWDRGSALAILDLWWYDRVKLNQVKKGTSGLAKGLSVWQCGGIPDIQDQ